MLLWLLDRIGNWWPGAPADEVGNVAKITFRAALAAGAGFAIAVVLGPRLIAWLHARFREPPCERSPELLALNGHKAWTPTMGGLFIVAGIAAAATLLCDWGNSYVPIVLGNLLGLAAIGAADDYLKLAGNRRGLRFRTKLFAQAAVALVASVWLYNVQQQVPGGIELHIPITGAAIPLGLFFIPLSVLVVVGSSNAVNLTDGLDGLASGCLITASAAVAAIVYVAGHSELAGYLGAPFLPEAGETVVIAAAMIGGTLGFLWFNCHPAAVFMGDTGSLALGGTLGLLAVIARQELLLLIVGGVFVAEAVSVILQVLVHRWTRRRVFRCAPLHHHFQLLGWPESKIVARFWIVAALCAVSGLGAMKLNRSENHPKSNAEHALRAPATDLAVHPADDRG